MKLPRTRRRFSPLLVTDAICALTSRRHRRRIRITAADARDLLELAVSLLWNYKGPRPR